MREMPTMVIQFPSPDELDPMVEFKKKFTAFPEKPKPKPKPKKRKARNLMTYSERLVAELEDSCPKPDQGDDYEN